MDTGVKVVNLLTYPKGQDIIVPPLVVLPLLFLFD